MKKNNLAGAPLVLLLGLCLKFAMPAHAEVQENLAASAQNVLEQRCMVCHGCYDAPCQLKLEAHEGMIRGASKASVYSSSRLVPGEMTRLFDDGLNEQQWRDKGFYSVLDAEHADKSTLYRMLELKQEHPLPVSGPLPEGFDFSLYRDQQCPKPEEFDAYARDYPDWGMPYGLPGLNPMEHQTLVSWLEQGAQAPQEPPISPAEAALVKRWESFLNGNSNKERLMSRYLYEHLFLASLHLQADNNKVWYRVVRSFTPPGRNLGLMATRRPFDAPKSADFYYRLQRMPVTPLAKIHMPYRFDQARMDWYRELFLSPVYDVSTLPGYEAAVASNPFKVFEELPLASRYRFLLEEAQYSIMNFIKGPVCRGQVALNVIDDHFWVMFSSPDVLDSDSDAKFLARESDDLQLPSVGTGTLVDVLTWRRYAKSNERYQQARLSHLEKRLEKEQRNLTLDDIWDGDGHNPNAALTIFRHFDTASVVKGLIGAPPKTAWVIGYPLLERIHYLLVAGFDVYGDAAHQLRSRLYMDFLRIEGELNFLLFMPRSARKELHDYWYRGARGSVLEYLENRKEMLRRETGVEFSTDDPKQEFLLTMRERLPGAGLNSYNYRTGSNAATDYFTQLEQSVGAHNGFLPEVSFVNVIGSRADQVYTFIRNAGHSNIAQMFGEETRRLPEEDSLTIVEGFIGGYPNYFFQIKESQLASFTKDVLALNADTQARFLDHYGVRRNAPWFWSLSDKFHRMQNEIDPITAGLFDYNRYRGD